MGSESILLKQKPKSGFQGLKKRNTSLSYQKTPNRSNKDKKLIPARNSHITSALNILGILGQVWFLIVSIPDICTLTYFESNYLCIYVHK